MTAKEILKEHTYSEIEDMDNEDGTDYMKNVVSYEKEKCSKKIDSYVNKGKSKDWLHEKTHDWWLDYQISDKTEDALDDYIEHLQIA